MWSFTRLWVGTHSSATPNFSICEFQFFASFDVFLFTVFGLLFPQLENTRFLFFFFSKGVVCCLPFWVWLVCYNWVAFAFWVVGGTWLLSILSVAELFWLNQCNLSFLIWLILGGKCIWAPFSLFYEIRNLQLPLLTLVVLWLRWRAYPELQSLSSKFNVNLPK